MQKISNINIRVNDDLKKQASDLFEYFGMSLSQAITLFLKQAVNTSSIPFEIKAIFSSVFPIITSQYWFATSYILLLLSTPILQAAIVNITKKQYGGR